MSVGFSAGPADNSIGKYDLLTPASDGRLMRSELNRLLAPSVKFVLLKGEPGTGKTMLALELLAAQGRGMYISTRVSLKALARQNETLRKLIDDDKIREYYGQVESGNQAISFSDDRLGSVKEIMQEVLGTIKKRETRDERETEQLIVLDSWDAIAGMLEPMERKKVEHALLTMADANNLRLIFVSEIEAITDADYMVDAIVELQDVIVDGRRLRHLLWKKLRGQMISQVSSLYSLNKGSFTVFSPSSVDIPNYLSKQYRPTPHQESMYSTGSDDLDKLLFSDGVNKGSVITLELDSKTRIIKQWPLGLSIALNFMANGGCAIFFPPLEIPAYVSKKTVARYLPEAILNDSLRIFCDPRLGERDQCFVPIDPNSSEKTAQIIKDEIAMIKRIPGYPKNRPSFHYVSIDAANKIPGLKGERREDLIRVVKQTGGLALLVVQESSDAGSVRAISDICLKLTMVDGSLVMCSSKPPSPHYFHFDYDYHEGYPKAVLTPIV